MRNTKKLLATVAIGLVFAASSAFAEQVLRLSHNAAPGNPKDVGSLKLAELVAQKTNGRIKVDVAGVSRYGDDVESLTNMRLGSLALATNSQGSVSNIIPEYALLGLPFLFRDLQHAYKVIDGPVKAKLDELSRQKGLVLLALWDNGIRHTSNSKRPITKPEDLAGLKLRTPPDPMTIDIFTALGANPAPLAFAELYIALQQGVMDGQENPLMNIWSSKLHEVQKYISYTGHKWESTPILASKKVWDTLSKEDQTALLEAAEEAGQMVRKMSMASDAEFSQKMKDLGIQFNDVDKAPFIAKTKPIYDKWTSQYPEFAKLVVDEAAK
ncbi:C4-dicarboxylate ABC transporter [Betaproteobacteria bacterium]|nr:C4-dicarboxylate ABC transporter [Betaproteobacteria bacterium]